VLCGGKSAKFRRLGAQVNALGGNCHSYERALNNLHDLPGGSGGISTECMSKANFLWF
jgi:hypothetical protein